MVARLLARTKDLAEASCSPLIDPIITAETSKGSFAAQAFPPTAQDDSIQLVVVVAVLMGGYCLETV